MAETLWEVANLKPTLWTVQEFCLIVGKILTAYNKLAIDNKRNYIHYYPAYPDSVRGETEDVVDQSYIITYDIYRREDGSLGKRPFSDKKERKLTLRGEERTDDGQVREIYGKRFDNMIRFDCFAPTTWEAESLISVFERIMEIHRRVFKTVGIDQMTYEGRLTPLIFQRSKFRSRACLWYVRDEMRLYKDQEAISQIELTARQLTLDDISDTSEELIRIIEDSTTNQEE